MSEKNSLNREEYYTVETTSPRQVIEVLLLQSFKNELSNAQEKRYNPALPEGFLI